MAILSYTELKIKEWELDKLIETRNLLAARQIRNALRKGKYHEHGLRFNMDTTGSVNHKFKPGQIESHPCGTVACIGGWMHILNAVGLREDGKYTSSEISESYYYVNNNASPVLEPLFYPGRSGSFDAEYSYAKITEDQAVIAIDKFLATGKVDWSHVKQRIS